MSDVRSRDAAAAARPAGPAGEGPEAELAGIGPRVRAARVGQGLTLHALAARAGVAASTVQKVETGQMVPSVAVLLKVARGLGRRLADLVQEPRDGARCLLLREGERHPVGRPGAVVVERLSGDLLDPALELWRVTLHPGHSSGEEALRWEGEALAVGELGRATFTVEGREHRLGPGDALHWKASLPHAWRNDGAEPARFLLAGTLPQGFRAALHARVGGGG